MTTLNLGVVEIPYAHEQKSQRGKKRKPARASTMTTFDVAMILEDKYEIMETFYNVHKDDIDGIITEQASNSLQTYISTGQAIDPSMPAMDKVQTMWHEFMTGAGASGSTEAERTIIGAPTEAALKGVSHRRKHPYAKSNPRRPSFVDTGLYESSFRAWLE